MLLPRTGTNLIRKIYARALFRDAGATLDDLRESVATLEELTRTARRVLGGTHATTVEIEGSLRDAQFTLRARATPPLMTSSPINE